MMTWTPSWPDNTNTQALVETGWNGTSTGPVCGSSASLGPYVGGSPGVYRCPADVYDCVEGEQCWARVRSISMNEFIEGVPFIWLGDNGIVMDALPDPPDAFGRFPFWRAYRKEANLTKPSPANLIVFLDEHPDTISVGFFSTDVDDTGLWWSLPASYHNGAGTVCFADGHSEVHKWQRSATRQPVTRTNLQAQIQDFPGNVDINWMTNHVSCTRD